MTDATLPVTPAGAADTDAQDQQALRAAAQRWGVGTVPIAKTRSARAKALAEREQQQAVIELHGGAIEYARTLMRREPPKPWIEALRAMSPKSDAVAWLYLTWKEPPGKPERGRWVLYECTPDPLIPTEMRQMLGGTPYWELPPGSRAGREQFVSAFQWEMYRLYRVWARSFWCLQGDTGGTPMVYSEVEAKLLKLKDQPVNPPALGALSYAPWDGRVERALKRRDRLWKVGGNLDRLRKAAKPEAIKAEEEAMEREFRREFMDWWADRLQEQSEFLAWYDQKCEADHVLRRATKAEMRAAAQMQEQYVDTGVIPTVRPWES